MRTTTAPTIRLKNYSLPDYLVEAVDLDVSLDPTATRVRSRLKMRRNKAISSGTPLQLDGDELTLISLKINGKASDEYMLSQEGLTIVKPPSAVRFVVEVETEISPATNTKLMGLYQSSGVYCTQCEAEGFRRITYFPDRPDIMAIYTVRLEADRATCPVLLSNGNPDERGTLPGNRHFAIWHDPHPKPSYLFAMVGGDLDVLSDSFQTAQGKNVDLNIYVEKGKRDMASFAMDALKRSMVWDEQTYGCAYDLDVFNIVAVSDFNMGAMENKGLNIFNDKYVLANPDVATDADYMHIEAIIAHEYFHNWTGNRITCRDWFQLCLKEGLTVYRDQEFSADTRSRGVQRIHQVRLLKAGQFAEDAGPLAHPVRPNAYKEINNFYTATVYQKGAELVRMLATMVGEKNYRKATDLYFKRHDGEAAVVEDFVTCFEDASGLDLSQFYRWYEQAGTPIVDITGTYDPGKRQYHIELKQSVPPTPRQGKKKPVPIPVRFSFMTRNGAPLTASTKNKAVQGDVILLTRARQRITFEGVKERPVPSWLCGFSAPVLLQYREPDDARLVRARHDADPYNRWEALNGFALKVLIKGSKAKEIAKQGWVNDRFVEAFVETVLDDQLDADFRAQILTLPSAQDIAAAIGRNVDPDAVAKARKFLIGQLGKALGSEGVTLLSTLKQREKQADDLEAAGLRALKNGLAMMLLTANQPSALELVQKQFATAQTMTDRLAALSALVQAQNNRAVRDEALASFFERHKENPLVIDKWFALQALIPGKAGLEHVKRLSRHAVYTLEAPNRARALLAPFASQNHTAFHRADGAGYVHYIKQILALDQINPQVAARMLALMNTWRLFDRSRQKQARKALQHVANAPGLSRDTSEIVERMLQ